MQVDWTLPDHWEGASREAEQRADHFLVKNDVKSAWHQYLQACEYSRMADQPAEGIRLANLALGLTVEGSEPAFITKLHVSGCYSSLGDILDGQRCLDEVDEHLLPPVLSALFYDIRFGQSVTRNDAKACMSCLDGLARNTHPSAQLSLLFRRAEWAFLSGEEADFRIALEQSREALKAGSDNGAGTAALSVLEGDAATCQKRWHQAEAAYLEATKGYTRCRRLGPLLSVWGRLAWVYFETNRKTPEESIRQALAYSQRFKLRPLQVGLEVALGLGGPSSDGVAYFQSAWTNADALQLRGLGARARYLFSRRFPEHSERDLRLKEALRDCGLNTPLKVLIKAEMC